MKLFMQNTHKSRGLSKSILSKILILCKLKKKVVFFCKLIAIINSTFYMINAKGFFFLIFIYVPFNPN